MRGLNLNILLFSKFKFKYSTTFYDNMNKRILNKIEFLEKFGIDVEPEINRLLDKKINKIIRKVVSSSSIPKTEKPTKKSKKKAKLSEPEEKIIPESESEEETSTE
ncbi:MAG: hypothetical protein ACPLGZ_01555 [Candidatus Pelagibacter ubique]